MAPRLAPPAIRRPRHGHDRVAPRWRWTPPAGGVTIWSQLPDHADSAAFAQAALRRGVAVIPGRLLSVTEDCSGWVRLAFTRPPDQLTAAIAALAEV